MENPHTTSLPPTPYLKRVFSDFFAVQLTKSQFPSTGELVAMGRPSGCPETSLGSKCGMLLAHLKSLNSHIAEHYPSRVRLQANEPRHARRAWQSAVGMGRITSYGEREVSDLNSVENDCILLLVNANFIRVPLAQWIRSDLRGCRKRVDGARLMEWFIELIGIRIEATVINLNLQSQSQLPQKRY